jgi:hypothetical protein
MQRLLKRLMLLKPVRGWQRPCAIAWLVLTFPSVLCAASFTVSLDRSTILLGESAQLSLTFEGGEPKDVPEIPTIQNLRIAYAGASTQLIIVNGQSRNIVTHTFTVTPQQLGEYVIPAFAAEVSGQRLTAQPLSLKVLKPGSAVAGGGGEQLAILKLLLPKEEVYLGEITEAELRLYLHSSVQSFGNFHLTTFPAEGFNVGKMVEGQRRLERIGSAVYTLIPVRIALTPVKSGQWNIGPVGVSLVVELPSPNRRRDPFMDPFAFGMFDRNEQKEVTLATEPKIVRTLALPAENAPADFTGAVGSYRLTVTAGPTNVAAGDPVTVRVQIAGRGALDAIMLPEQSSWSGFKTYPPTSKVEPVDALGIQGTKTFEQIVVPQSADIRELPPFSFSFFDPEKKAYRTLTQPAIALDVRPGGATAVPAVAAGAASGQDNPLSSADIVPIKQRIGAAAEIAPPLIQQPLFLVLQGVPVLALLCSIVWRKRSESLARNPRLRRQRLVAQIIREGLGDLRRFAAENRSDDFFAALFRMLQEQIGERLSLPASAITEAVIEEHLQPRGAPEATVAAVRELFQACNLARYAPVKTSQELAAVIPRVEDALRKLRELKA